MNEKILIKSNFDKKWKWVLLGVIFCQFMIALLFLMVQISYLSEDYKGALEHAKYFYERYEYRYSSYEELLADWGLTSFGSYYFNTPFWDGGPRVLVVTIFVFIFIGLGIISTILYFGYTRSELLITETNVKGKTFFGKEVTLPMHMVSAYATSKIMSVISVTTSSGITKFFMIENAQDIGNVLTQLLNKRQKDTEVKVVQEKAEKDELDDLKKLKSFLDSGIITQEEYEIKKKQILGL